MTHPFVCALASFVVLLSATLGSSFAQSNNAWPEYKEPPAELGYTYDGPASWSLDGPEKPASVRRAEPPVSIAPKGPATSRWSAPVVPARPRLHSAFDESLSGATASQEDAVLAPQRSIHADTYRPPISEEPIDEGSEGDDDPSWTDRLNAAKQSVVGGWNWLAIEANESFGVSDHQRRERRRFFLPGCGRRKLQR